MGRRTLRDQMKIAGISIGRFNVWRLIHEAGLRSCQPCFNPDKMLGKARANSSNLLDRQFDAQISYGVWCGDNTYIRKGDVWHYITVMLHLCWGRRAADSTVSEKSNAQFVINALRGAQTSRSKYKGLMSHSHQGPIYASWFVRHVHWCGRILRGISPRKNFGMTLQ